jgi:hypothetical protein
MIAITFDVDDVAWSSGTPCDELGEAGPVLLALLAEFPTVRTTWFVRLDDGIAAARGRADALFTQHASLLAALRGAGHEVAWHHHAVQPGTPAEPCTDPQSICHALRAHAPRARALGLRSVRLGWAFATADILACLDDLGFVVDSTALPRPSYPWDVVPRDWECTPHVPYRPSRHDHRRAGHPACALLEVPMSVAALSLPSDTQPDVQRYVNPAYHAPLFARALHAVASAPLIVTVTHPYECVPGAPTRHELLAHDLGVLRHNLAQLCALGRPFVTLHELGASHAAAA